MFSVLIKLYCPFPSRLYFDLYVCLFSFFLFLLSTYFKNLLNDRKLIPYIV